MQAADQKQTLYKVMKGYKAMEGDNMNLERFSEKILASCYFMDLFRFIHINQKTIQKKYFNKKKMALITI